MVKAKPEIYITLEFNSLNDEIKDFDADEVTKFLQIQPTKILKINDKNKHGYVYDKTSWHFEIVEECHEISIPFLSMFNLLQDKIGIIKSLREELNLELVFGVIIYANNQKEVLMHIPKQVISLLAELETDLLYFDEYYYKL